MGSYLLNNVSSNVLEYLQGGNTINNTAGSANVTFPKYVDVLSILVPVSHSKQYHNFFDTHLSRSLSLCVCSKHWLDRFFGGAESVILLKRFSLACEPECRINACMQKNHLFRSLIPQMGHPFTRVPHLVFISLGSCICTPHFHSSVSQGSAEIPGFTLQVDSSLVPYNARDGNQLYYLVNNCSAVPPYLQKATLSVTFSNQTFPLSEFCRRNHWGSDVCRLHSVLRPYI